MKFLSLFSGIEACSVAWEPLGWQCVGFSEIDPFPCAVLAHHYPHVPNLGDVTTITEEQVKALGQFDVLVFGSPCFPKGAQVLTSTGYKSIEHVEVGDKVMTHTQTYKPVLRTGGKPQQMLYQLRASGVLPILCTAEHPFYTRKLLGAWSKGAKDNPHQFTEPTWVEAQNLSYSDYIAIPVISKETNLLGLSEEDCYILGRYLAAGYIRKGSCEQKCSGSNHADDCWKLILSVSTGKLHETLLRIKRRVSVHSCSEGVNQVVITSKRLVQVVEKHLGCEPSDRFISPTLLNLPKPRLQLLLRGYVDGGGTFDKEKRIYKISTSSRALAESLVLVVAKLYQTLVEVNHFDTPKPGLPQSRVNTFKEVYTVGFRTEVPKRTKYWFDGEFLWTKVNVLKATNQAADVFNLEVAVDNTYTVNNVVVHNCQDLSIAGVRKGLQEGTRSNLFYEALRIFDYARKHNNCRFALWENVPGAFSSNKGADFAAVVREMAGLRDVPTPRYGWGNSGVAVGENGLLEWRVLDAQYFGLAQRRKRVFAILDTGDWEDRPPILFERESLSGCTPPRRETEGRKISISSGADTAEGGG